MKSHAVVLCFGLLLLAACGKQDVHSACYKNGDHDNLSDGRITRICDCMNNAIQKDKPSDQDVKWIVAWFNKKPLITKTPEDEKKASSLMTSLTKLKTRCDGTK